MQARSVADIPEEELVRELFSDPMCQAWIAPGDLELDHRAAFSVSLRSLVTTSPQPEGDVDLLLARPSLPERATAIQLKRVKIAHQSYREGRANKLKKIPRLAQQTNLLVDLGFHRVCAVILVVVDSRALGGPNPFFNTTPPAVVRQLRDEYAAAGFHELVSVAQVEICQPFDRDYRHTGSTGGKLLQPGGRQLQPPDLSDAVARVLTSAC